MRTEDEKHLLLQTVTSLLQNMKQNIQMGLTDSQGMKYLKINSSDDRKII